MTVSDALDLPSMICPACQSSYVGHLAVPDELGHDAVCLACEHRWHRGGRSAVKARKRRRWTLRHDRTKEPHASP